MQTPSRREFLSAVGITTAIIVYDTMVANGEEELLPLEDLDKAILEKIQHARKSMVVLEISDESGNIIGTGSGFILKEIIEEDGKKLRRLVTARHCAVGSMKVSGTDLVAQNIKKSEEADVAIATIDGMQDVEGIDLAKDPIKGQEVILIEPEGLREGGFTMSKNEGGITILDEKGFPPIRTFVKKVLSTTDKMLPGLDTGEAFQMEHFITPGASGSPILTLDGGEVKAGGVLTGFSIANVMSDDEKNATCETDMYAASASEVTKLLHG